MNNRIPAKAADFTNFCVKNAFTVVFLNKSVRTVSAFGLVLALFFGLSLPLPFSGNDKSLPSKLSLATPASATAVYHSLAGGNLTLNLSPTTVDMISSNDNWTNVPSVEGYMGRNLTATHGVDPQTVLGTEFTNNALPDGNNTQVNANKGNPSAYNAGGLTEFDRGDYLAFGFQGNVQANPYIVFYLDTTGQSSITVGYEVKDIDGGSNNSVSPIALQYRVGSTGNFINLPDGYIPDATEGPNAVGKVTSKSVQLPADAANKPQVQVRLITTNAAASDGTSTPDEWIGVNNVVISSFGPTASTAIIGGRILSPKGSGLANAMVLMFDSTGNVRTATSNAFGYYRFNEVATGETYILEVRSKRYVFTEPMWVVSVMEDNNEINFSAEPFSGKSPSIRGLMRLE